MIATTLDAGQEGGDVREHRGQVREGRGRGRDAAEGADPLPGRGGEALETAALQTSCPGGPRLPVAAGHSRDEVK